MEEMEGLWLVLLTSSASVAVHGFKNFLSDPNLKFRNFATKIDGRRLNGSFFKEFNVTSEIFCQIECVADSRCSSYNLRPILGMEMFVCQLNQGDRFMGHQNFTDEDGAIYRGIQVSNKARLRNIVIQLNLHVRPASQNTKNLLSQSLIAETCRHRRTGNFLPGGAVNHLPKKISQVAQIFTKESKRNEGHIATTKAVLAYEGGSIQFSRGNTKSEHKLRRHKQTFRKIATTVVLR